MSTAIRFYTERNEIGTVTVKDDGTLDFPPILRDLVRDYNAHDFIERYADWSNGYLTSQKVTHDPDALIRKAAGK